MKQILFVAFLALVPALADQVRAAPVVWGDVTAMAGRTHALGPIAPIDALSQERLAELCQHRS